MATSRDEISRWFDEGIEKGATHMLVLCDTFDWTDYPVFVNSETDARAKVANPGSMQKTMEVYCLAAPKDEQLSARRCFRYS